MLIYKARIVTESLDRNGLYFTKEALEELAKTRELVPVIFDREFEKAIGSLDYIDQDERGYLVATIQTRLPLDLETRPLYLVPCGVCNTDDIVDTEKGREISKLTLYSLMITLNPADDNLTPIERSK